METIKRGPADNFESLMLISKQASRYKRINGQKTTAGKFYTQKRSWLTQPVREFIEKKIKTNKYVLDPFAGGGHLLESLSQHYDIIGQGYDLSGGKWPVNDSLAYIPNPHSALICTNPPYLAKHSAKRKGVFKKVEAYYARHYDLYELAITRCLSASRAAILIIPETFLHSAFPKNQLKRLSVITENPFNDTENPVCAACFESTEQEGERQAKIYIGDQYICRLSALVRKRKKAIPGPRIVFNDPSGNIALKAVDGTDPKDRIRFESAQNFYYGREKVTSSSRLLTYINIPNLDSVSKKEHFLKAINQNLEKKREKTADLILSPFKGNNKAGRRRRRLDYALARDLISSSLSQ